jgi:ceramide glucosyltransferase
VLRDPAALRRAWCIPFRDLWGFAIWVCGLSGDTVEWRGARMHLSPDGKILQDRPMD